MPQRESEQIERRAFVLAGLRVLRAAGGAPMIVGHAAVFNQLSEDLGGFREQIVPGAFAEAIEKDDIRALWNHNSDAVLGRKSAKTLRLVEDQRGLAIEIDPPETQIARDGLALIERGDVTQMSFAFSVRPGGQDWAQGDHGELIRTLKNVRLYDVSPVTFPAYPQTEVAVRSLDLWLAAKIVAGEVRLATDIIRRRLDLREKT